MKKIRVPSARCRWKNRIDRDPDVFPPDAKERTSFASKNGLWQQLKIPAVFWLDRGKMAPILPVR
jgi:hypothetical protein